MKLLTKALLASGAACILATLVIALLLVPAWVGLTLPALLGIIMGELILFAGFAGIEQIAGRFSQSFLRLGLGGIVSISAMAAILISAAFFTMPLTVLGVFLSLQALVLLFLGLGTAAVILLARRLGADAGSRLLFMANEERVNALSRAATVCRDDAMAGCLKMAADDVRFFDASIEVPADMAIQECVNRIEGLSQGRTGESSELGEQIHALQKAIEARKGEAAIRQRGGF